MTEENEALRLASILDTCNWLTAPTDEEIAAELRRLHAENEALRAALAAVRFQCEADAKAGEWTTSITKLLDAIKAAEKK